MGNTIDNKLLILKLKYLSSQHLLFSKLAMYHKAYALDSDGNILHTRCEMLIEKGSGAEKEIKTVLESELPSYFNQGRDYLNGSFEAAAHPMRTGGGKYAQNLLEALENQAYGPIWETFKKINRQASPTAIITARGHDVEEIKAGHRALFHEALSEAQKEEFFENMQYRL